MKRRNFIRLSAAAASTPFLIQKISAMQTHHPDNERTTILFQGDSITDAGRDKKNEVPNNANSLGNGYAFLAATRLFETYPKLDLRIYNRGISGNRVHQLADRWDEDAIRLNPDVLSIMIGVNDHWHSLGGDYKGTAKVYKEDYDNLLRRTLTELPSVKLIICEPFILTEVDSIERDKWIPVFDEYREISKELALKYDAAFVPFQSVFDQAISRAPAEYWAPDGVHPSLAGAQLMADHWMKAFQKVTIDK